jgi:hypothetical protein
LSQVHKVRFHFLAVAASAQDLQVSFCVLAAVEDHTPDGALPVVTLMTLWDDAVKLQLLGGGALGTASSELEEKVESSIACPDGRVLGHQIHSPG